MKHIIRSARPRRRLGPGAALFLAITSPSLSVLAQEGTKPPPPGEAGSESGSAADAIAIIDRAIEAMGGEKAIESIESARYTLESRYEDKVIVRSAITVSPDLYLVKEEPEHGRSEVAFNGDIGWSVHVFEDTYMCVAVLPSRFRAYRQLQPWDGFTAPHRRVLSLRDSVGEAEAAHVAGRIRFDGRDCWKIVIPQRHGGETIACFDAATDLLTGIETVQPAGEQTIRSTTVYEDWRQCGPIRLPMTWSDEGGLRPNSSKTTITDFQFNTASRSELGPPRPAIEVIRVRLLDRPEDQRPPLRTPEEIGRMTIEEVRQALTEVATLRRQHRGGDEAVVLWLKWEFRWLMDHLKSLRNR
ncbi:MAG: hypothetical protein SYC29_14270 [Planctomycetota bacterium]|nr:hypothetical protein [Planctomycetota bacterium]